MATTMTTVNTTPNNEWWASRTKRRRDAELSLLRRPSETGSHHTTASVSSDNNNYAYNSNPLPHSTPTHSNASHRTTTTSPTSPHSSNGSIVNFPPMDQISALQLQLRNNQALIKTNEARMQELEVGDRQWGNDIQERLNQVMRLNEQLSSLRGMLEKVKRVSQGEFGVGFYDGVAIEGEEDDELEEARSRRR